jgi:hypothetical protein
VAGGEPDQLSSETRTGEAAVAALVVRLRTLSEHEKAELAASWDEHSATARQEAWSRAKPVITQRGGSALLDRARADIAAWARLDRRDFSGIDGLLGRPSPEVDDRRLAALATIDAAAGLLAAGELSEIDRAALCGPWEQVVGSLYLTPRDHETNPSAGG